MTFVPSGNGMVYGTDTNYEYKRGYREGFQDGYAAAKKPQIVTDQNGVILYWPKGVCTCGNPNCNCGKQMLNEVS